MPLICMWTFPQHLKYAPPVLRVMWVMAGICFVITALISGTKHVQIAVDGFRTTREEGVMMLPVQTVSAMIIVSAPLLFSLCGILSLSMIRVAYVWQLVQSGVLAWAIRRHFVWMLDTLGNAQEMSHLIGDLSGKAWWCTPPLCCCGPLHRIVRGPSYRFARFDMHLASFLVCFYTIEAQVNALIQILLQYFAIKIVHTEDGYCSNENLLFLAPALAFMKYFHVVASMACVTSLTVVRKAVAATLDGPSQDVDGSTSAAKLNLNRKFLSVALLVLLSGLLGPIAGALSQGQPTPVLREGDTVIVGSVGCPVYDHEAMTTSTKALLECILMVPVAILCSWAYQPHEDAATLSIRRSVSLRRVSQMSLSPPRSIAAEPFASEA
eukprot:TRINITY_DN20491_c0_g1_i1.p1 TRINITY_DN20491_c0_g1~~TRINITY_DN20491_c0_g1_i1.p1  ORF type:complete len:381 (-),score=26.41 TRINITY_DN20491_c0_g1_i1:394-1536(-)